MMTYFNVKCHFIYTMTTHKHESIFYWITMLKMSDNMALRKKYNRMMMSTPYRTLWQLESTVFEWCLLVFEINILLNLSIKDCMFVASITKNFEGCSIAKFDSNWVCSHAWGSFNYWCWLVIHIIPIHRLFIWIHTHSNYETYLCYTAYSNVSLASGLKTLTSFR